MSGVDQGYALAKAAEMRTARATLRKQLKAGEASAYAVLTAWQESRQGEPDAVVGRMRVRYFLLSLPGIGPAYADRIMDGLGIDPTRRIQGVGRHQLTALVEEYRP